MKKLILLLSLLLILVGCASEPQPQENTPVVNETPTTPEPTEPEVIEEPSKEGYFFKPKAVSFTTGEPATPAMDSMGEYLDTFSAPSCAFEGEDTVYKYDNFELYTYDKNGEPYISGIFLLDESASTPEGLHIGSTVEEMISLYGENYEETVGSYTYLKGDTELIVVTSEGEVISITYILKV